MLIEVTADDIAKGRRMRACECPIALATQRALNSREVSVGVVRISHFVGSGVLIVTQPEDMRKWRQAFDAGLPVEPQSFEVGEFREEAA